MRYLTILVIAVALSGCGSVPPYNFAVPDVGPSKTKLDAELRSLTVEIAGTEQRTGKIPDGLETLLPLWKESLEDALNHMAIFTDDASEKVSLSVRILKFDIAPGLGERTTTASARYELINRKNGDIIFTQDIQSTGAANFDDSMLARARLHMSINRSVENNIANFLQVLQTTDLSKPMVPASSAVPST